MNTKISEAIFGNDKVLIPMADVQHIEKLQHGDIWVIMKSTRYDYEADTWNNPVYIQGERDSQAFIKAYCYFRYEKDIKEMIE